MCDHLLLQFRWVKLDNIDNMYSAGLWWFTTFIFPWHSTWTQLEPRVVSLPIWDSDCSTRPSYIHHILANMITCTNRQVKVKTRVWLVTLVLWSQLGSLIAVQSITPTPSHNKQLERTDKQQREGRCNKAGLGSAAANRPRQEGLHETEQVGYNILDHQFSTCSVVFTFCFLHSRLNENYGLFSNNVSTVGHDNFTLGTRAKG